MKHILVIGAGRSSSSLIRYLLNIAETQDWEITLTDRDQDIVSQKINNHPRGRGLSFDALNRTERLPELERADLVISMLPARFHLEIAKDCLQLKKNLITPSYITPEMKALDEEVKAAGLLFMNEIGLDPGIDHLSAMRLLDQIRAEGGEMTCFESCTGGLVAPESDNNPWGYKFTWNPRNVVLAGQGGAAKFYNEGKYKYIPYHKLFRRTELIEIEGYGKFEGYANRDSLKYRDVYNLQDIPTIYRGTFRRPGYCRAWNIFVQLGMTDDSYVMEGSENMTYREFVNSFLTYNPHDSVELKLQHYMNLPQDDYILDKLEWLELFSSKKVGIKNATPAQILQHILEQKWNLDPEDKDMIVMWHKFGFKINGENREIHSSMVSIGEDQTYTAMSNTVGLPVGIAARLMLNGKLSLKGVQLPLSAEIYNPVLDELKTYGIKFFEKETEHKHF